jgi:hypothetical protein
MLPRAGPLIHRDGVFAFDYESIEILCQQNRNSLRHRPDHPGLDVVEFVENSQRSVLKDRIGIQYEEPGFHKWRVSGKN